MKTRKAYTKYKRSGVEWLGDVPEHWELKKVKYSSSIIMGQSPNSDEYLEDPEATPFLQGNADFTNRFPLPRIYCEKANKIVEKEALLISVRAPVGAINEADKTYGIGRGLCAIITKAKLLKEYAWFAIHITREELYSLATGSTYDAVSANEVGNMLFPLPPLSEQQAIANYLDKETTKIDSLIEKQQRLIALLKEQRTSIISQTVTKGLEPMIKMKNSGVEWLGNVPDHWEIKKLKWIYQDIGSGDGISPADIEAISSYPVYGGNGIMGYAEKYNSDMEDMIIGRVGAKCGNVYLVEGKKWISDNALILKIEKINKKYLKMVFEKRDLNKLANQNAQPLITGSMVGNQFIPVPPFPEQQAIANYLDKETTKIDELIDNVESVIIKLKEYRSALIAEVITGKIDVRAIP